MREPIEIEKELLHFGIGEHLSDLARDAYWYESKHDWAREVFHCFQGLEENQIDCILSGRGTLVPLPDGNVNYVERVDQGFIDNLSRHISSLVSKVEYLQDELYALKLSRDRALYGTFSTYSVEVNEKYVLRISEKETNFHGVVTTIKNYNTIFNQKLGQELSLNLEVECVPLGLESEVRFGKLGLKLDDFKFPRFLLEEYIGIVRSLRSFAKHPTRTDFSIENLSKLDVRREEVHDKIIKHVAKSMKTGCKDFILRRGDRYREFSDALERELEAYGAGLTL